MPLSPSTKLGPYEIVSSIGAGSMGEVYRAHDSRLNRDVAIKVLPANVSTDADRLYRFETEAKAAAALNHPNILAVYEMGNHDGIRYIVSELLEGKTLSEALRRGPLPLRTALDYGIQIAHGLGTAHEKGIIHRDLKPDNVFVTKSGRVKILDFGLAKVLQPKQHPITATPTVTLPGVALGTVGYMSPEQVRGQSTDQRTDIFAFGAILYEMVMGRRSFQKNTEADTISAILNEEPPPISVFAPDTPAGVERIIRRCLEKSPEQRFQSASDLAFALEAMADPSIAAASGAHPIAGIEPARRPIAWLVAAVVIVSLIAVIAYSLLRPAPPPRVANYVQLTHDGQPKALIATDGSRLYLSLGEVRAGSFASHGAAQMSISGGGDPTRMSVVPSLSSPFDLTPGGSQILAISGQGAPPKGPVWTYPILGGSARKIDDIVAETAAFSPDGKWLAYTNLADLFIANADGSGSRKLLSAAGDILSITWSPDSTHLRFGSSETAGTSGLQMEWEVAADGTGLHRLLEGWHNPPNECCGKWTADGKYFVFQSNNQIWALAQAGLFTSNPQPIQLTSSPMALSSPLPSKDGKKLFMIGQTYRGELMRYDTKSAQFAPFLGGISAEFVDFSKDGQWVVYVSYRDGTLWRSKVDGSQRLQLTDPPMYPVLPRWSPDGKKIVFFEFGQGADKPARIYETSLDGESPRQLMPNDSSQQFDPNWSPDGTKIVFAGESNDPASAVRILDLATKNVSEVPGSQGFFSPRWSPDERHLTSFSADSKTLLLFDFQTQKWMELATGSLGWLNWSHDSQYVYMLDSQNKDAVVRIRISDKKIEQVADLKDVVTTGRYGAALSLAPDDSPVLLRDIGSQDVYSVDWIAP
jgi:eukaryotic-like serine/threonine-protein kinase